MLAASDIALQHAQVHTPRPLPLFLDMVRRVAMDDPELAGRAMAGVRRYAAAKRDAQQHMTEVADLGPLKARTFGANGPPVVLVPSLINPAWIMDLDADRSLLQWLGNRDFRAILLDWGYPTPADSRRDMAAHVTDRLLPALSAIGEPVHLVGYCLGGVLATAAAALHPVRSLSLIATPWHFAGYSEQARAELLALWMQNRDQIGSMGLLPMEILQSAFWSLDPVRSVAKFAELSACADDDPKLMAFARLEDWANSGAPLTQAAGRDLFESLIGEDQTGNGGWRVGGQVIDPAALRCRGHQFTAANDRIAPATCAAQALPATACPSGHVGMMVGRKAERGCWEPLAQWLSTT